MGKERKLSLDLVKSITVKTCVSLYDDLRKKHPEYYQNAPSEGLELTVNYADTWKEDKYVDKIVLAVHGMPGNYSHFDRLLEFYRHNTNVRVIAPNLPDFSHTRATGAFWHSTAEKVQFLKDFLHKLGITKIDCLVSHSFGVQTIAALWEKPGEIEIKSVALFSPQPLWDFKEDDVRRMKRIFRFKSEWWYNFLSFMRLHKLPFTPMRLENINEFLICCSIIVDMQTSIDIIHRLEVLVNSNIPVVLLYGSCESLISKSAIRKLNEQLKVSENDIITINPENDASESLTLNQRISSYVIVNGGHFAHANYYAFSNKLIENLLNYTSC